jgi:hypothetical protein
MASMTMPKPPTMALPASSRPIARKTSFPSPLTEIIEAMTTIDSESMIVWFRPARMVGVAKGSSTLNRICRGVAPKARAASTTLGLTLRMPSDVRRTKGGSAKMMVTMTPETLPMPIIMTTGTR